MKADDMQERDKQLAVIALMTFSAASFVAIGLLFFLFGQALERWPENANYL